MDGMTLLTLALLTVVNLAALYIDNRNRAIKYREIGEAINRLEKRIEILEAACFPPGMNVIEVKPGVDERLRRLERVFSPDHQL
ncbi:MAG: hypothetical protein KJ065_09220 [Anaerolineae bacterium]|nr:hypothetical protein [Anaerolineae bacterium]